MQNYTVYHLHTENSLLDSCTNYKLYVDKAVELGQTAICFTEHGNTYNWVEKKIYCEKKGLKYIHGIECYLTESLDEKIRDNYHTILIAKNYEGFKELNLLIDLSTQSDHFYYKPRITFDEFLSISNNIIAISACLASPLNRLNINNPKYEKLVKRYDYLEIQPHNCKDQKDYNLHLITLAKKYNKPLIAGTDTHSLNPYKAECRSILQRAKKIVFTNEDEFDLTYKSYDELLSMFESQGVLSGDIYKAAIENTNVMANSVEAFTLDTSFKYPKLYGDEDETVMKHRISTMYKDKLQKGIIKDNPEYKTKILEEMRVFKKVGMVGFMLFMSELVCYCWENNIPIGFCRGSVGGSEIAYITDIIDVDPVIWNTVFSRFCNEDRKEIGDIDIDVSPTQRHLVYEYIINRFGADKTAYILAMGTVSDKGTIDEICRALEVSLSDAERIKKEYDINPEATKKKYPNVFYYFDGLLNTTVSQSMHPAGIIASPVSLPDNYGTFWSDGKRILSINMEEVHEVSLVKYDILGLKNIEICKDACEYANINYPKSHEINWNDENVWNDITSSPVGIFQFEGDYAADLLKKYLPRKINDLSLVNASLRPSGASYRDRLIAREKNHNPSQLIDDLLADNDGFLVFQEDCIKFLKDICGLSGSDADNVRRAIGRKQADRLQAALPQILEGYCNKSPQPREVAEKEAKVFLQIIEDSSNYQFGFNHSTGYSMIGYLCAYLRYYYSIEFITSYLNNANNEADIANGTMLAKQKGIKIFPIKFRHSKDTYSPDKKNNAIYKGIASVKFLNADVAKAMYEMRDTQFDSFIDFLRVNPCNSRQTEILIKLDFFSEFGKSQKLLTIYDIYNNYYDKKQFKKDKLTLPEETVLKYSTATDKMYKITDMNGLISELLVGIENKSIPLSQRLQAELEYLGYIDYINDKSPGGLYYVMEYKTYNDKCKPYVTLYHLKTGESVKTKVTSAKEFSLHPFKQGNILNVWFKDKYKSKMIDGKWVKTDELEKVINTWEVY
jgi:DNA polymerase III subunit alpha